MNDTLGACRRLGCKVLLVEEYLRGPSLGVLDIFSMVAEGSSKGAGRELQCIAYVDTNPEHDTGKMRFAETVAVNRGVSIRVFPTVNAAEKWLQEQLSGQSEVGRTG
jgi:hypothetical protein